MFRHALVFIALIGVLSSVSAKSPTDLYNEAQVHLQDGDRKAAVIQLKNVLQQDPGHIESRLLLGDVYLQLGDGAAAEKEISRARSLNVSREQWVEFLGRAYILQGKFDETLDQITTDVTDSADLKATIFALRGNAYIGKNDPQLANEHYDSALELVPQNFDALLGKTRLAYKAKEYELGLEYLDTALATDENSLIALLLKGELHRSLSQYELSVAAYERAIKINRTHILARLGIVSSLIGMQSFDKARTYIDGLRADAPDLPAVNYMNALLLSRENKVPEAKQALLQVIKRVPNHMPSHLMLGIINFQEKNYETASDFLGRYRTENPSHLQAAKVHASVYLKLKGYDDAIDILENIKDEYPEDASLFALLGRAYMQNGDHSKGIELTERALELSPDAVELHTQLGLGRLAMGESDSAVKELELATEMGSTYGHADMLLIMAHLREGREGEALAAAQRWVKKSPENPVALNMLGAALIASDNADEAKASFEKAITINPKFGAARGNLASLAMKNKDYAEAEKQYELLKTFSGMKAKAFLGLAKVENARGNPEKMLQNLEAAAAEKEDSFEAMVLLSRYYLSKGKKLKALDLARQANEQSPTNMLAIKALGLALLANDEASSAVSHFQRLQASDPERIESNILLSTAQAAAGNLEDAKLALDRVFAVAPDNLEALLLGMRIAVVEKSGDEAKRYVEQAIEAHPQSAKAYYMKGDLLLKQYKNDLAVAAYRQAYDLAPSSELARRLFSAYRLMKKPDESIAILMDWLEKEPKDIKIRLLLAMTLQAMDRHADAIPMYTLYLETAADDVVALNNLAWSYNELGDKRAIAIGEKAYELNPESADVADTLGWILLSQGHGKRALIVLQDAAVHAPQSATIRYHLAEAYYQNSRNEEALKTLKRLLRDHAKFPEREEAEALLKKVEETS